MNLRDKSINFPHELWTSESVTEGHPDKVCDQISDAVLDACLKKDSGSRVACEVAVTSDLVMVFGEITTGASLDIESIVRRVLREIGYTDKGFGIDADTCKVLLCVNRQSLDIASGVDGATNTRKKSEYDKQGAGDQGMMFGFACDETKEKMPMPIMLSHRLTRQLSVVRKSGEVDWLRPDGKAQVTVEYKEGVPSRVDAIVVSTQHSDTVSQKKITEFVKQYIIDAVIPQGMIDRGTRLFINPSGRFVIGGPVADAGLTGRKIIVDTYGGMARHGGGAFSGKDASKVDRAGAYFARWVARNIVASGLASRVEIQVSYAIGKAEPTSVVVDSFGTSGLTNEQLRKVVLQHFDFRPLAIIEALKLKKPVFRQVATYGHFGRDDLNLSWERETKARVLKKSGTVLN